MQARRERARAGDGRHAVEAVVVRDELAADVELGAVVAGDAEAPEASRRDADPTRVGRADIIGAAAAGVVAVGRWEVDVGDGLRRVARER